MHTCCVLSFLHELSFSAPGFSRSAQFILCSRSLKWIPPSLCSEWHEMVSGIAVSSGACFQRYINGVEMSSEGVDGGPPSSRGLSVPAPRSSAPWGGFKGLERSSLPAGALCSGPGLAPLSWGGSRCSPWRSAFLSGPLLWLRNPPRCGVPYAAFSPRFLHPPGLRLRGRDLRGAPGWRLWGGTGHSGSGPRRSLSTRLWGRSPAALRAPHPSATRSGQRRRKWRASRSDTAEVTRARPPPPAGTRSAGRRWAPARALPRKRRVGGGDVPGAAVRLRQPWRRPRWRLREEAGRRRRRRGGLGAGEAAGRRCGKARGFRRCAWPGTGWAPAGTWSTSCCSAASPGPSPSRSFTSWGCADSSRRCCAPGGCRRPARPSCRPAPTPAISYRSLSANTSPPSPRTSPSGGSRSRTRTRVRPRAKVRGVRGAVVWSSQRPALSRGPQCVCTDRRTVCVGGDFWSDSHWLQWVGTPAAPAV